MLLLKKLDTRRIIIIKIFPKLYKYKSFAKTIDIFIIYIRFTQTRFWIHAFLLHFTKYFINFYLYLFLPNNIHSINLSNFPLSIIFIIYNVYNLLLLFHYIFLIFLWYIKYNSLYSIYLYFNYKYKETRKWYLTILIIALIYGDHP